MERRAVLVFAVAAIAAAAVLLTRGEERVEADADPPPIATIAARVEKLRGLEFKTLPKVRRTTAAKLQRQSARRLDRLSASERRRLKEEQDLLALLGFASPKAKPSDIGDTSGILGIYDHRTDTLTIVTDAQGNRAQRELTIAHELVHALEDQHFGLGDLERGGDDATIAKRALAEGSAHATEALYARRHLGADVSTKELARRAPASTVKGRLDYFANSDRFAYLDGARYVSQLRRAGGLQRVDSAFRVPPTTTEKILHPGDGNAPKPLRLRVRDVVGDDFSRLATGSWGEFDTSQLLLFGAGVDDDTTRREAAAGAAGWAAGRYELWRAGERDAKGCSKPCVERDLLVIGWTFDSAKQTREFVRRLAPYLEDFQRLRPTTRGVWRGRAVAASVATRGRTARLAIAPAPGLAKLVATKA